MVLKAIAAVLLFFTLSGCSIFTEPKLRPVIEDKVGKWGDEKAGTLATTPERRIVLVKLATGQFCAEPSPDAAENIATNFAASAAATTPEGIQAQIAIAKAFASNSKQLFARTQGVQMYRDGMYGLCQALLNGGIDKDQFLPAMMALLDASSKLVDKELDKASPTSGEKVEGPKLADLKQLELQIRQAVEKEEAKGNATTSAPESADKPATNNSAPTK